MSVFPSQKDQNYFITHFCSKPLEIPEILDLNEEQMIPHDFYERLVGYRNECAERFLSRPQLHICEYNLHTLAVQCQIRHKKYRIEPQKAKTSECFPLRVLHRVIGKSKESSSQAKASQLQEFPQIKACHTYEKPVIPRSGPMWELIEVLSSHALSVGEMSKLALHVQELSQEERDESSPHVLYEQLMEIRDKFAEALEPQELKQFEKNLERLAEACLIVHVFYFGSV